MLGAPIDVSEASGPAEIDAPPIAIAVSQ